MKIGIDARPLSGSNPTGIGVYLINVIEYIAAHDKENEYVLYSNKPVTLISGLGQNFSVKVVPGKVGTLWLRYKMPKHIKKDGVQVFWGTQHILPKKVKGIRYVLTVHDVALLIEKKWGAKVNAYMQNTYLPKSVKDADVILTVSQSTKNDLIRICSCRHDKINVVYISAADREEFEESNILSRFSIKGKFFFYVGTLEPRKNILTAVKSFELLAKRRADVSLVLAGGAGGRSEELLSYIERSPYKDRIILTGYIAKADKLTLFSKAEALVFISHYEGFGIPVLEAFTYGCPVITAKNSSLTEVGGNAALYVEDENDPEEVCAKYEVVLNLSAEERDIINGAAALQREKFSWEKCAGETLKYLLNTME